METGTFRTLCIFLGSSMLTGGGWAQIQAGNNVFKCDESFCLTAEFEEVCPVEKRNCTTLGNRRYLSPDKCNCCKDTFCSEYIKEGAACTNQNPQDVDICGPYLTCRNNVCSLIRGTNCMDERKLWDDNYESGTVGTAQFKPACDDVGRYAQRQCLPGSVCFCTNSQGKRIFGVGLPTEAMSCRCSKDVEFLTNTANFPGKLPRCLPNGDYDPIQCVDRTCWCRLAPSVKQPIGNISELLCYDKELHDTTPADYLRTCEYRLAQMEINKLRAEKEYAILLEPNVPRCDQDGLYAPVQPRDEIYFCADRYGQQIENFEIPKSSPNVEKVDCHCARIRKLMEDNVSGQPRCCKYGNFRRWQCSGSLCYCVDRDGKQIVTGPTPYEVRKDDLDTLPCYTDEEDDCVY